MANEVVNNTPKLGTVIYAQLRTDVSFVSPVAHVEYIRSSPDIVVQTLATQVSSLRPATSVYYVSPVSDVSYVLFSADIVYGVDDGKVRFVVDKFSLSDSVRFVLTKLLGDEDILTLSDGTTIQFTKGVADSASTSDVCTVVLSANKVFIDTITATDSAVLSISSAYYETILNSEVINVGTFKYVDDEVTITDDYLFSRVQEESPTDAVSFTDDFSSVVSFDRSFSETIVSADVYAMSFETAYADAVSLSAQNLIDIGKNFSDTRGTADTGSLNAQGYCDITYSKPDYVGEYRPV